MTEKITLKQWRALKNSANAHLFRLDIYMRFISKYGFARTYKHVDLIRRILDK